MKRATSATTQADTTTLAYQDQSQTGLSAARARQAVRSLLVQRTGRGVISDADLDYLADSITSHEYRAGDVIVRQGVRADAMGLVTRGQVACCASGRGLASPAVTRGRATQILLPGSVFGEAMLTDGTPSPSTLRAVTDAEVWFLRRAAYLDVAENYDMNSRGLPVGLPRWLLVLALAAIFVLGAAAVLSLAWPLLGGLASSPPKASETVADGTSVTPARIIAPANGAVKQIGKSLPVRAVLMGEGLVRAELRVDGTVVAARGSPEPITEPWAVELDWREVQEGQHALSIRAEEAGGAAVTSAPITVTVVPTGILAFASNRQGDYAVYEMQSNGTDLKRTSSGPDGARQPAWIAGGALSWTATPLDGKATIRAVNARRDEGIQLYEGRNPAWSADGRLAYDAEVKGTSQVFANLVPDGVPRQITAEETYAGQPSWSPDGKQLAYVARRNGISDIWIVDIEGGEPVRLTDSPATEWSPAWAPNGEVLAFVSDESSTFQVYLMRIDSRDRHAITDFALGAESPAWSPDGRWLAVVAYSGAAVGVDAREIYLLRADGQHAVRLTNNQSDDTEPAWGGQ